jgi:hypothetical protein
LDLAGSGSVKGLEGLHFFFFTLFVYKIYLTFF